MQFSTRSLWRSPARRRAAFTVLELIMVITIMAMLLAVGGVAAPRAMSAYRISAAAHQFAADLSVARQTAVTQNCTVYLRFYYYNDDTCPAGASRWLAYQFLSSTGVLPNSSTRTSTSTSSNLSALTEPHVLGTGVAVLDSATLSTVLDPTVSGAITKQPAPNPAVPGTPSHPYADLLLRPDGSLSLPKPGAQPWCVTISNVNDTPGTSPPLGSRTVVINPYTAGTTVY